MTDQVKSHPEGPMKGLSNLFFNIILPTLILNKGQKYFGENGPLIALVIALIFPLTYGLYDYLTSKKRNIIAIIGIVSILLTGGLALLKLSGFWFAVKEASIPLIIGLVVLASAFSKKPLIQLIILNDALMNVELIHHKLQERQNESPFYDLLRRSTLYLSFSFFLSSLLNFLLAQHIFVDISTALSAHEQSLILNEQIAQMTWKSYIVIALPSLVVTSAIILYLIKGIHRLTGLEFTQVLKS